jgi:hypothetical protein
VDLKTYANVAPAPTRGLWESLSRQTQWEFIAATLSLLEDHEATWQVVATLVGNTVRDPAELLHLVGEQVQLVAPLRLFGEDADVET